jgi:prepilin-type N-terminal cleavage/methylation domain-containing protein
MRAKQKGFTIVELLIVVVIIGILAAITLVAYNGAQTRASIAAVKSDLNQAGKLVENYQTLNGQYPTELSLVNGGNGFAASRGNSIEYTATGASAYCMTVSRGTITYRQASGSFDSQPGACPGHGPALPAQIAEYNVANYPNTTTTYPIAISTPLQPTDILVTILKEHYAVWDAYVAIDGVQVPTHLTKSLGTGARVMDITVSTGLTSSSNVTLRTDGSPADLSYYILRGVRNPSALTSTVAGWVGDGDDGNKPGGFVRTIPAQTLKSGQIAILAVDVLSTSGVSFPYDSTPIASEWVVDNSSALPVSAHLIGTSTTSTPIGSGIRIGGSNYVAGALLVLGN